MEEKELDVFFEEFLSKKSIFKEKKILQSNYTPDSIFHRESQINQIARILAPALKKEKTSNIFIYGKTGTGKTLCVKYIASKLQKLSQQKSIPLKLLYVNCKLKKVADTEYRLIAHLAKEFGKSLPPTGLPTDEVYTVFYDILEKEDKMIIIILDEIDELVKKIGDEILYNLTRINSEIKNSQISLIGISNNLLFTENLDPRIKSSLSEEEILFQPYNANQIKDVLAQRAKDSFSEGVLEEGVLDKCAALAAREHGDARRAIELLRVAGELAERESEESVKIVHLDKADEKIEQDKVVDIIDSQPKQHQIVLYAILLLNAAKEKENTNQLFTGEVYNIYQDLCTRIKLRPLTQRRVGDILTEFDMQGILNIKVISKGRYGRTREIGLNLSSVLAIQIQQSIQKELNFSSERS